MAFAQVTFRESLRDIEVCLQALGSRTYQLGFRGRVTRSTLGDANNERDWRVWCDFANILLARARKLYAADDLEFQFANAAYLSDTGINVFYSDGAGGVSGSQVLPGISGFLEFVDLNNDGLPDYINTSEGNTIVYLYFFLCSALAFLFARFCADVSFF